jgi:hypothetical protein
MADRGASNQTASHDYDFIVTITIQLTGSVTPKRRNFDKPVYQLFQK